MFKFQDSSYLNKMELNLETAFGYQLSAYVSIGLCWHSVQMLLYTSSAFFKHFGQFNLGWKHNHQVCDDCLSWLQGRSQFLAR